MADDWRSFRVGDLVTRDGSDVQRIIAINDAGDLIDVECVKAPLGYLNEDGSRDEPWCEVGETESNCAWRYSYAGDVVDGSAGQAPLRLISR